MTTSTDQVHTEHTKSFLDLLLYYDSSGPSVLETERILKTDKFHPDDDENRFRAVQNSDQSEILIPLQF